MEKSKLEKVTDPQLIKYGTYVNKLMKNDIPSILEFIDVLRGNTITSKKILAPIGGTTNLEDIEYLFCILTKNNLDDPNLTTLNRPTMEEINVSFRIKERVYRYEVKSGEVETYLNLTTGDLDISYLHFLTDDGIINPWEWYLIDSEDVDGDVYDTDFEF